MNEVRILALEMMCMRKSAILSIAAGLSSLAAQEQPLVTSGGKVFTPKPFYPDFTWDTVPLYQMFADDHRLLSDREVEKIAATSSFICIEKNHGVNKLGSAELGAKHESARFKKVKPRIKALCYFNSAYTYPFTSYNQRFARGIIQDADKKFLVRDPETGELASRGNTYFFDVLNPDLRKWWSDTVGVLVKESGTDGLFVDQMHGFVWLRKDRRSEVAKAQAEMMRMAKEAIGEDKILLLNNAGHIPALLEVGDAFMFEHYNSEVSTSKEAIVRDWAVMKKIAERGKIAVYRFGADPEGTPLASVSRRSRIEDKDGQFEKLSKEQLDFFLACYLIGAQPYSYFQYGWGWSLTTGPLTDYSQLEKPLGPPLGEYKRVSPQGWVFTREFEHASVWLDLENRQGRITWQSDYAKAQPDTHWTYKTANDKDLNLSVFLPDDYQTGTTFPTFVIFHGGGWGGGSPTTHYADCAYWSSRGMIAITAEYRLKKRDNVEVPLECVKDAKSAIRYLRKNAAKLKVDPNRIVVAGASAGGQLAAATAMITSEETNDGFFPDISSMPNALVLYNPWFRCPEPLSPPKHVRKGLPPTIIFLGDKDPVPVSELLGFRKDLMEAGNVADLHVGIDGKHGFCNGRNPGNPYFYWSIEAADTFLVKHAILSGSSTLKRPANLRPCRWKSYTAGKTRGSD